MKRPRPPWSLWAPTGGGEPRGVGTSWRFGGRIMSAATGNVRRAGSAPPWDGADDPLLRRAGASQAALPPARVDRSSPAVTLEDGETVHRGAAAIKLRYSSDTDSLYIDLAGRPSAHSREVTPGVVVLDFDAPGALGIDIDRAGRLSAGLDVRIS